ncbi:MAG: phenylalanine--tRNA ligase subunit alpha [Oscillospiraceae bacterium]|nr:phenylalanine--tRNA ligase subunit alpha [Oscillospiraceae bacterium]
MREKLAALKTSATDIIAAATDVKSLEEARLRFLGKKGALTAILKQMGTLSAEERPQIGAVANRAREHIEAALSDRLKDVKAAALQQSLKDERLDVTLPGKALPQGHFHPLNIVVEDLKEIFHGMGYTVVDGPEVECVKYVFDMLNTHEGHPAREPSDTFYIDDDTVLRTQTSSVQIRTMLETKPPIAIISPGRVYRVDESDATHSPVFHQCEGLVVGEDITFADLKGTLETFMKKLYGDSVRLRFRPHHFPYTEPSAEVDLSCFKCGGEGCSFCKGEGWLEMLGSGVVHPDVLRNCGIDPNKYTGFAFGIGLERIAMMRYAVDDIRLFYENDVRFLSQF